VSYRKNSRVQWKYLGREVRGIVLEKFTSPVTRRLKGKAIKRNGSRENPAYLVRSDAGNEALKLSSELSRPSSRPSPKMFS
jgi:hypothetical protein